MSGHDGQTRTVEHKRVVVTGIGVVSPVGIGKDESFLEALLAGRSGVRTIQRFDTTEYPVKIAAEVDGLRPRRLHRQEDAPSAWTATPSTAWPRPSWPWRTPAIPSPRTPTRSGALIGSGVGRPGHLLRADRDPARARAPTG